MGAAMALESGEWAALAGVFVVILAVLLYNQVRARVSPLEPKSADAEEGATVDSRLSRFAVHDGEVVGETVAIANGQLILKQAGVFKSVPESQAKLAGDEVLIEGDVDWDAARAAGATWLSDSTKGQDDAVTSQLTTSDDVRSPAREAFERRQAQLAGTDSEE